MPPVLVLAPPRFVGPLGVIRTLRPLGVRVYVARTTERSLGRMSRYCAGAFDIGEEGRPVGSDAAILEQLEAAARRLGPGAILIAGSDEWAVFVATHADPLGRLFKFPHQDIELVEGLASKQGLYELARKFGLPTPRIARPADVHEAAVMADDLTYPVMLKPVLSRPGRQFVSIASNRESLLQQLQELDDPGNVLCQEYIPGTDADVWIFNGYFDAQSRCLAAFTGRKLRQHPARMGLCALGEYVHNPEVIELTEAFLAKVGYTGIVDIGYRWDKRDGAYKVLDINPRLGGAFRLFVDANGLDVARACYLDLTGRPVPAVVPNDGRRWVLEAADLIALKHYRRDDGLRWRDWLRSFRGVQEGATFSLTDPLPFLGAMNKLAADTFHARWDRFVVRPSQGVARRIAAAGGAER
ncbi:MAG TPA: hypothetical protein VLK30_00765 [Candidatus Limnocylindrales bacterium]|nr:hypothetical protein [Candidatus Limnocylindrales bacterium]